MRPRVGVVGASGYSGAIAARLLAAHPDVELAFCTSDRFAGKPVEDHLATPTSLTFEPNASALALADQVDAVVLATSAKISAELAPAILERKKHVVDLSGAFRLASADEYTKWYGFAHPAIALLGRSHYGLPELFGAPPHSDATLVANPGCYPTAALLPLTPLLRAGLVESTGIIIDAKSGVTGAGRQATEEMSFAEVDEDLRAYRVLGHQHTPEIRRALERSATDVKVTFTPHLLPIRRGILATCYARPRVGTTREQVAACLADAYAKTPFVRAVAPERVSIASVAGTNHARVGVTADADVVIAFGAIDNLVKGAAGQAVQNLNLLFSLDETSGLSHLQRIAP
jgi:N-acetyl-gamma-glutamyl-phosphate reductase